MTNTSLPSPRDVSQEAFHKAATPLLDNMVGGWMARNSAAQQFSRDEFESAANLAMLEAYAEYDPARSDSVTPFLINKVRWGLLNELNRLVIMQKGFSMSEKTWEAIYPAKRWIAEYTNAFGSSPSLPDLRKAFPDRTDKTLRFLLSGRTDEDETSFQPMVQPSAAEAAEARQVSETAVKWLDGNTTPRNKRIYLRAIVGEDDRSVLAAEFGITKQRVEQVVNRLTERLQARFGVRLSP